MLVSYRHNLIFIKRQKVAGTSIEMFLQKALGMGGEIIEPTHAIVSDKGIIGFRGAKKNRRETYGDERWYNHIHAKDLRHELNRLDLDIWTRSLKVAAIRNPFDQAVSHFYWCSRGRKLATSDDFSVVQQAFTKFVLDRNVALADPHLTIDGINVIDRIIRFEALMGDLENLCGELGVTFNAHDMPVTKSTAKQRKSIPVHKYYTNETITHIHKINPWIFNQYNYADLPDGYEPN